MIKVVAPNMACRVLDMAIQAFGAAGVTEDYGLAKAYAHARTLRLADGRALRSRVRDRWVRRRARDRWAERAVARSVGGCDGRRHRAIPVARDASADVSADQPAR